MSNRFRKNVEIWSQKYPQAAIYLPFIDCSHLDFQENESTPNLKTGAKFFHSSKNPVKEAEKWFSNLDLQNVEVLFVYGVGVGYAYQAAFSWLKENPDRHLIFLEDDLAVIRYLFETENGSKIVKDPQVQVHFFTPQDVENPTSSLSELFWSFLSTKIVISALPYYEEAKKELFDALKHRILYDATLMDGHLSEYLDLGVSFFKNFYPNLQKLPGAYLGDQLFGKFKNVPAIICGAGPSLEQHLPLLKNLRDKALIFAGGSGLNALHSAGVRPHFGAGIDPNPGPYDRLKNIDLDVPFLYRNRLFNRALDCVKGPRLYVTGSGGYDISEWIEKKLKIKSESIEEGYNVINFCMELANAFGCNPIIFVGMDLAYTNMKIYPPGVVEKYKVSKDEILNPPKLADQAILRKDIYGKPIYTMWKWLSEAQWMGTFAKEHPEVTLINATEGGIGFPNVLNEPLKKVIKERLTRSEKLEEKVKKEIEAAAMPQVTPKKINALLKELRTSLVNCKNDLEILLEETLIVKEQVEKEKQPPLYLQSGRAALCETEMAEEIGYKYVLDIFNRAYTRILMREVEKLRSFRGPEWKLMAKKLEINVKKLNFLYKVTIVNIEIIDRVLEGKQIRGEE